MFACQCIGRATRWGAFLVVWAIAAACSGVEKDPYGVPYEWIDQAPRTGVVKEVNEPWAFFVASLRGGHGLKVGNDLAVRRDGVILAVGRIESFETDTTAVLKLLKPPKTAPPVENRPRPGDDLISYPPRKK